MITKFTAKNFKALRDVSLELTPIHVLIGPNDSGKTSIMQAISTLSRSVDMDLTAALLPAGIGSELSWQNDVTNSICLGCEFGDDEDRYSYNIEFGFHERHGHPIYKHESVATNNNLESLNASHSESLAFIWSTHRQGPRPSDTNRKLSAISRNLSGALYCRWNPQLLSLPVAPDPNRQFSIDSNGFGLALCLDDILSHSRGLFTDIERRFIRIFPEVESIRLAWEPGYKSEPGSTTPQLEKSQGKGIHFVLRGWGKNDLAASQVSDGYLLALAYLTVLHLPVPPRILMVEEPENGIHPQRLEFVIGLFRELMSSSRSTQIIMTTHSPYVVDLFRPEEVTVCHKRDDGSVEVRRLSESKPVQEQMDIFTLGEIWTAEGDEELVKQSASSEEAAS